MPSEQKNLSPIENNRVLGHENAEKIILNAIKTGKIAGSWLFYGPKGIGKATFAYNLAKFILSSDDIHNSDTISFNEANPNVLQIVSGSHPDLKIVDRGYSKEDREKIAKAISQGDALDESDMQKFKKTTVISVDEVREINKFFSKTSANNGWRIVIVDSVDELNFSSANAILKILEEPPQKSIVILISHNPNAILPTIKSRCAKLAFAPLKMDDFAKVVSNDEGLYKLSSGSCGKATAIINNNIMEIYNSFIESLDRYPRVQLNNVITLAEKIVIDEDVFDVFIELLHRFISILLKRIVNAQNIGYINNIEESLINKISVLRCVDDWVSYDYSINEQVIKTKTLNLDKKQTIINIITGLYVI